jgi:hypothetical protein
MEANCVQSFENIPEECVVTAKQDEQSQEANRDLDESTNGGQQDPPDEKPKQDQVHIEVREGNSNDRKGLNSNTVLLTESQQLPIHIWSRGAETATCDVNILQNKQITESIPQIEQACGNPITAQNRAGADATITFDLNTKKIADSDATYDLQVIVEAEGEILASIEKRIQT